MVVIGRPALGARRGDLRAAVIGDESQVAEALGRLAALGVTDFTAVLFPVDGDPDAPRRTREFLAEAGPGS